MGVAYVMLGTIICLNMLIAIMTNSFELLNDKAEQQLAFLRVETTYDLAHRGRMMPPPFNVFVIAVWALITFINALTKVLSCGRCKLKLDRLNPYYIACLRRGTQHGSESSMLRRTQSMGSKKESKSKQQKNLKKAINDEISRKETIMSETGNDNDSFGSAVSDKLSDLFEQIDSLSDDTKKRYCKHCYYRMEHVKAGKVDKYFEEFGSESDGKSFGLDKDDMRMIKRLFRYCSLCPQCYRPYGFWKKSNKDESLDTDRFDRHHVLMHVISCYFFLLFVWVPLIILCAVPALLSKIFANLEQIKHRSNKKMVAKAYGVYHDPKVEAVMQAYFE